MAWQAGERGRREGESYERDAVRGGWRLLGRGDGGSPERELVQRRLTTILDALPADLRERLTAREDPFLADIIWWKAGRTAVVEVSRVVDAYDVERAHARAQMLASGGADALPMVIGEAWRDLDVRAIADTLRLAWMVGREVNERFRAFHALTPERLPGEDR
jgi:hypothetical protein